MEEEKLEKKELELESSPPGSSSEEEKSSPTQQAQSESVEPVHPLFGETDYCPVCKKSIKNMMNEHGGKILQLFGSLVLCIRCGVVFLPKSQIKHVMAAADRKILPPPPGLIIQP